ncbi:hypothetical protein IAD21_01164 [Abditibacteriota bacterium]|nr:hypothetical protein IAD21_01164 [Abditibacteriota bacterium]
MKLSRKGKWMVFSILLLPAVLFLERTRRMHVLLGTWEVIEENSAGRDPSLHLYERFEGEGRGEEIIEWKGKRGIVPFQYSYSGLSRLDIVADSTFCGTDIVPLNDSCLETPLPKVRTVVPGITLDANRISFDNSVPPLNYWQRTVLKPLARTQEQERQ